MESLLKGKDVGTKLSFPRRLIGTLLAKRAVFRDIAKTPSIINTAVLYPAVFFVNVGLVFLFLRNMYTKESFSMIFSLAGTRLTFIIFLHFIFYLLCVVIYHGLCRLARGKARILSTLEVGAYLFIFTPIMLSLAVLALVFIKANLIWLLLIIYLIVFALLIWRIVIAVRAGSEMHEITTGKALLLFLILIVIAAALIVLSYFGFMFYISTLLAKVML